jgi:hypothetical protein
MAELRAAVAPHGDPGCKVHERITATVWDRG